MYLLYRNVCCKGAEILARELGIETTGEIKVLSHDDYLKTRTTPLEDLKIVFVENGECDYD